MWKWKKCHDNFLSGTHINENEEPRWNLNIEMHFSVRHCLYFFIFYSSCFPLLWFWFSFDQIFIDCCKISTPTMYCASPWTVGFTGFCNVPWFASHLQFYQSTASVQLLKLYQRDVVERLVLRVACRDVDVAVYRMWTVPAVITRVIISPWQSSPRNCTHQCASRH